MAAESDTGEEPTRPVIFDHTLGWAEGAGMAQQEGSALRHVAANHAARQAAAAPDTGHEAPQQADAQQEPGSVAENSESAVPLPNSGWGQDRPAGTYAELSAATPASEQEAQTEVAPPKTDLSLQAQEGQDAAQQPASTMTARERHEARLQAYIQGDREEREAAKEETASRFDGTDAAIKDEQEQGTSLPPGGGMSR